MIEISKDDVAKIAKALGANKVSQDKESYRIKVVSDDEKRVLTLYIYPKTQLGKQRGALILVYTAGAHVQLHNVSGYVISDELQEVTFVSEVEHQLSGTVISRDAFCSQYAGVNRDLLSSDFSRLGIDVMMSGVALSLTEDVIEEE
ncbi:hypothetical protein JYT16_00720 [Gemmatimonas aurantiaca]|nr:hypothetical protein [Gemmatimonas aurantiaca]